MLMYKMLLCYDIRRPGAAAMLVGPVIRHSLCALSISHFPSKITDFLCRQCWFAGILLLSLAKEEAIS